MNAELLVKIKQVTEVQVEKAYDLKALVAIAKAKGLPVVEEQAEVLGYVLYETCKEWLKKSAPLTDTIMDDMAATNIDNMDNFVYGQIEKIDLDGDGK